MGTYSDGNLLVVYEIRRHVLLSASACQVGCLLSDGTVTYDDAFDGLHGAVGLVRVRVARKVRKEEKREGEEGEEGGEGKGGSENETGKVSLKTKQHPPRSSVPFSTTHDDQHDHDQTTSTAKASPLARSLLYAVR